MRKNPPILAALAWMGLAAVLSAQDFFQTEGGDNIPLERNTVLSSMEVGEFHIEIQFQSTSINLNTGKFALPNYRAVYSLRPPGTDPTSQGIPWVFGQRGRWVPVQTGDFDENTGAGTAYIICPVNMSTVDGMWGITWGDVVNELTVYWGTASALAHDSFTPPSGPQVSAKTIRFTTATPQLALMWEENRSMRMDQPTRIMILSKNAFSSDKTFTLTSDPVGFFDLPSTVTIPAGEAGVAVPVTPRYVGTATIRAVGDQGETLDSSLGEVHRNVWPVSILSQTGAQPGRQGVCHPGGAGSPNGSSQDSPQWACGGCAFEPTPCPTVGGPGSSEAFINEPFCSFSFYPFAYCQIIHSTKTVTANIGEIRKSQLVTCFSIGVTIKGFLGISAGILQKDCCLWVKANATQSAIVNLCSQEAF